jgi:AcrR family transcriptional regulator
VSAKAKPARRYKQFTDRRLQILRSAAAAFSKSGFSGVTMKDIAERVDMAKGNLYYYFPSKQDLLFFCQEQSLGLLTQRATRISQSGQRADEQLRDLIVFHIKTIHEELPGSTAHTDFRSLPSALLKKVIRKRDCYERVYRAVIQRGIEEGFFRQCNVKAATWAILGALNWSVQWFSTSGSMSVTELGREFAELFLHAMRRHS